MQGAGRGSAPVKAQTSAEELAPAATTLSLLRPGNATLVQVEGFDPPRCQAVGAELPSLLSNAQPPFLPTVMITLKDPWGTRLTIRQAGIMGCALLGAARAGQDAAPVTASPATASPATASPATASRAAVAIAVRRAVPRPGGRLGPR
jgi:hypothetical protein